ncbi:MAG: Fic family protein, partial [Chitinophagales bacterium]
NLVDEKKRKLDAIRLADAVKVGDTLELEWIYHSNALEGSILRKFEIKIILQGLKTGFMSPHDNLDILNHRQAIRYIEINNKEEVSQSAIKSLHNTLQEGIDNENAGQYRNENVFTVGEKHTPPHHSLVPNQMKKLMEWYKTTARQLHPVERAAKLHVLFLGIKPFIDDNGRLARLILNWELMQEGYPPIVIRKQDCRAYYKAVDNALALGEYRGFMVMMVAALNRSLDFYLKAA